MLRPGEASASDAEYYDEIARAEQDEQCVKEEYLGMDTCLLCSTWVGDVVHSLGGHRWTNTYLHYLQVHGQPLDAAFKAFLRARMDER